MPIVSWYDADGNTALALNSPAGDLRSNGVAFRDFLASNNLAYAAPKFLSVSFKINAVGSTAATTSGNTLMLGNGFGVDTDTETTDSIHSKISVGFNSDGKFTLGDDAGVFYPAGGGYNTEQTVKWYVNNSGVAQAYTAPNGATETIANDTWDLWVGTAKAFDDHASFRTTPAITDLKFLYNQGAATIQFDNINISQETGTLLPVKLLSFTGSEKNSKVILQWTTASEQTNSHFNILHSTDGRAFKPVAALAGKGTSSLVSNYAYTDYSALQGLNYYQLEQVDYDGKTEKSQIIGVNVLQETASALTIFSVSKSNEVRVEYFSNEAFQGEASIVDMSGRKITSQKVQLNQGFNSFDMIAAMPDGAYVFVLRNKETFIKRSFMR